jgi:hypothetical protein
MSSDNVVSVVYRLLTINGVKINLNSVSDWLKAHPDYPSLKCVCDYFEEINVRYWPLRIDENDFFSITHPFIAHLNIGQGQLVVVHKADRNSVYYSDSLKGEKNIKTDNFLAKWSKTVIFIDPDSNSGESGYQSRHAQEIVNRAIVPFFISLFCFTLIYGITANSLSIGNENLLSFLILFAANLTGLFFSILLFIHEIDFRAGFVDKLCHISTHTDCDAVTKSKLSKVYANISWADVGVTYFLSSLILMCLLPVSSAFSILSLLSFFSLPYPVISILYQWLKIRKWCPLCISVQATLLAEFAILTVSFSLKGLTAHMVFKTLLLMSLVIGIVLLLKLLYLSEKEKNYTRLELERLKRNPKVFRGQIRIEEQLVFSGETNPLLFGNTDSKVSVTVFLSFHCSACSKKFEEIRKLLKSNDKVNVQLIFSPAKDDGGQNLTKLILQNYKAGKKEIVLSILEKWYESDVKSRQKLIAGIEDKTEEEELNGFLSSNEKLFRENNIDRVPSIYLNGFSFPDVYNLSDIKYHMDSIILLRKEYKTNDVLI